jgi:aspartate--ammonia ligase
VIRQVSELVINEEYESRLGLHETEKAIKLIKDFFQDSLAKQLNLQRVSAPLFVRKRFGNE